MKQQKCVIQKIKRLDRSMKNVDGATHDEIKDVDMGIEEAKRDAENKKPS